MLDDSSTHQLVLLFVRGTLLAYEIYIPRLNYNLLSGMSEDDASTKQSLLTNPHHEEDIAYQDLEVPNKANKEDEEKKRPVAKTPRKTMSRLICGYTLKSPGLFIVANVGMVISAFGTIGMPFLCGLIIDDIRNQNSLWKNSLYLLILTIVMAVSSAIRGYAFNTLGQLVMVFLRLDLFKSLMEKDINYYDVNKSGELVSRLTSDIGVVQSAASDNLSVFLRSIIQLVGSIVFLWLISWPLTLCIVITTPIISIILLLIVKVLKRLKKEYQDKLAIANSLATQIFGNIRIVKSFATEKKEYDHYNGLINKTFEIGKKEALFYAIMLFAITVFGNGLVLGVLYYGGHLVLKDSLTIGGLTSYVLYTITLTVGITSASAVLNQIISALGVCEKIFEIIDAPVEIENGFVKPRKDGLHGGQIGFQNVSFSYPTKKDVTVLKNVNLEINKGQSLALVGASGSGKSSMVSLILRFYDVTEGRIKYDGTPLVEYDLAELRQTIGYVSQEPTLFSGTLRENIEYGINEPCSKEWLEQVLKMANAYEFVFNKRMFPEGLDTLVGERGVKLSGGQKQRIAIARCLIKKPSIMIFDEATSALDAESEYQVQTAIDRLLEHKDKTIVIIAHRLSTIIGCDRIIVLKQGSIAEEGKHYQLLKNKGVYAALVDRQISGYGAKKTDEDSSLV